MSRKKLIALSSATAVVVAVAIVIIVRVVADEPHDVVRAYLEAARRGDVPAAMAAAGVDDPPAGAGAALLTSGKPVVPWHVVAVRKAYNEYDGDAEVDALISDGTTSVEGHFTLHESGGRWRITNPFAKLDVAKSPLRYAVVNGRHLTVDGQQQVLPGVYVQTLAEPGMVRAAATTHVLAIPDYSDRGFALTQDFLPEPAAQQRFQQLNDAYVDKCLTDRDCRPRPFSYYEDADGHVVLRDDLRQETWSVIRRPVVNLPGGVAQTSDGKVVFGGQVAVPGEFRVEGTTEDGKFTATCLLEDTWYGLDAWLDVTGAMQVGWTVTGVSRKAHLVVDCNH